MKPTSASNQVIRTGKGAQSPIRARTRRNLPWKMLIVIPLLLLVAAGGYFYGIPEIRSRIGSGDATGAAVARVNLGDLEIVVLEGGNVKALNSLELKSQVESRESKILFIVEEGYEVTPEDVKNKKVLIKLDPTEVEDKIEAHEIEYENAYTELTDSDEARAIQVTESQNEISEARQKARFALLDFEKYLGEEIARKVLQKRNLPADEDAMLEYEANFKTRLTAGNIENDSNASGSLDNEAIISQDIKTRINFAEFIEKDLLGDGGAQQELRDRQDELLMAQSEHAVQIETLEGSERLKEKNFITRATLVKERVALEKAKIKELSAGTKLELYRRYEFPKKAEELLTTYEDSLRSIDIEKKETLAKLSQAEAKFRNAEQIFKLAEKKRTELQKQLESCNITASKPGLVVYGSNNRDRSTFGGNNNETIEEGASVGFKRTIITIPDMTHMGVNVSIQESQIKKIKAGQTVRLVTEAETDKTLTGIVKKVAVLPDSNRWYSNPNQKVYPTEIHIDGTHDWLKPGMSAKVEIIVNQLSDVLYVPLQCVVSDAGETVVWVQVRGKPVRQVVKIGDFNDEFIEIKEGLKKDQMVYLVRPDAGKQQENEESESTSGKST